MKGTILCVDDDRSILDSLKGELRQALSDHFDLEVAETVDEANEILDDLLVAATSRIVVISDWLMPGLKGDLFLASVRERFPTALTILLSGQASPEAVARARELAGATCLNKPWAKDALRNIISNHEAGR